MAKIGNISGFPEWLPEQKLVEDRIIAIIKGVYESYGFVPIETPAVELLSTLAPEGSVNTVVKEIYAIRRAFGDDGGEAQLALHFDLTRPFARYTAQHYSKLIFPFKRYQLQKVWRGERPQKGRFREFYQFDIDTIANEKLPIACDAEILSVFCEVFSKLDLGGFKIRMNNRKILLGAYREFGLSDEQRKTAVVVVDKIDKIGVDGVLRELTESIGVADGVARKIVDLAKVKVSLNDAAGALGNLSISDEGFREGVQELLTMAKLVDLAGQSHLEINLSLARGLDYYTGLIFETILDKAPEIGSVCGGGRYEDLASEFINKKLPGIGASIGLTRLMDFIFAKGLRPATAKTLSHALVAVFSEDQRLACNGVAQKIRAAGLNVEVFPSSPKFGKQLEYADAKGIPFVVFVQESGEVEVRDMKSKEQKSVGDFAAWAKGVRSL